MKLDDLHYFEVKKIQHPPVFELAQRAIELSLPDTGDSAEIERRMAILARSSGNEHIRQSSNFVAEAHAFTSLYDLGSQPHWVPEQ
jgi:hypothetical protein